MELLDDTTPEQQARAARLESTRLCHVNGNPLTPRAFAVDQKLRRAAPRGIDSFLGAGDRAFLSRSSIDGCLPTAQTSGGLLPLQRAIELGDVQTLEHALMNGDGNALTSACNAFGETLLHTAVLHQQLEAVQLLLHHGASPLSKLPDNLNLPAAESTLESTAPRTSNFRYSRMLEASEATPLHYACSTGQVDILKLLLSVASPLDDIPKRWRPGKADCFDEDGNNSVAIAALVLGTPETPERLATLKTILKLLLRREPEDGGADVNHKNMYGLTALDVAETAASKLILTQLGASTARIVPVERVLRWDRNRFRDEIEYLPPPGRRRVMLRDQTNKQDN
ncbi:hypothetical protein PInf_012222 [Phytophthora infestans]|nr:hypothetical protein PInf_012222 [Phytophthora infestans]